MTLGKAAGVWLILLAVMFFMPTLAMADEGTSALCTQRVSLQAVDKTAGGAAAADDVSLAGGGEAIKIKDGVYVFKLKAHPSSVLTVKNSSILAGANVLVEPNAGKNGQKFIVKNVRDGYVRIGAALGNTVLSTRKTSEAGGTNICMEAYAGKGTQLWHPEKVDSGIRFVNKATGGVIEAGTKRKKANVLQGSASGANQQNQLWRIKRTSVNLGDFKSFLNVIAAAPVSKSVTMSNKPLGYKADKRKWRELLAAVKACNSRFGIWFVMVDCSTGAVISCNPDHERSAASTIKGLYATYLFEECLEKGKISRSQVGSLMQSAIGMSDNGAYMSLRGRFGTQSGFNAWLKQVGVGPKGTWTSYSPRILAQAWTHMLAYSNSKGKYVDYWKKTFNHSYRSVVRAALSGKRAVYSKPGWLYNTTSWHDGSIVVDGAGRNYIVALMSSALYDRDNAAVIRVVRALDAMHVDLSKVR